MPSTTASPTHAGFITGYAHDPFLRADPRSLEEMIVTVAQGALAKAGLDAGDIDEIYLGHFNSGFTKQDFAASLVMQADDALRFRPATRVENACATGSAAIQQALKTIRAGDAQHVLVVGVEKMSEVSGKETGDILQHAAYQAEDGDIEAGFAGVFARIAQHYFQRFGDQSEALARIASKNHTNGADNPFAQMRRAMTFEACHQVSEKNPLVAPPLRRTDCSLVSDGAAAVVISKDMIDDQPAIGFRAVHHVSDFLPMSKRDIVDFDGPTRAIHGVYEKAGITVDDLSFAEVHDCFTIAELMIYEAMGLAPKGKGADVLKTDRVYKTGSLPVNASGGLKSKGHPIGATGVSMHVIAAMQLLQEAGDMQLAKPELGLIFNMGGTGVANYASVVERTQ
ncbi:MAG: acetyl-CoA acetyltransferase [Pseudomonadota bacterium]